MVRGRVLLMDVVVMICMAQCGSDIISGFCKLYWRVREDWNLGHRALNCLVQLASLNGAVLINRQVRIKYLSQYLECLFSLLSR